jgi:hypothetical protein
VQLALEDISGNIGKNTMLSIANIIACLWPPKHLNRNAVIGRKSNIKTRRPVYSSNTLGIGTLFTLGLWIEAEKSLIVELPDAGTPTRGRWLLSLRDFWRDVADFSGLSERSVNLSHQ